jgi:hypothetical protein
VVEKRLAVKTPLREKQTRLRGYATWLRTWASSPSGHIWLDATWVWLLTRAVFVALTVLVPALLVSHTTASVPDPLHRWVSQDGTLLAAIAAHGYHPIRLAMMWPLMPLLEHTLAPAFRGDDGLVGLAIANAAFFGALVALRALAERELGAEAARRTVWYLALFPTAFYFFAPYTESLFLLLAVSAFAALRAHRWALAGLLGFLATLTRSAGGLLVLPFAVEFYTAWRAGAVRKWQALWIALIPAAGALYSGYFWLMGRDPLAYVHAGAYWGHTLRWPWESLLAGFGGLGKSGHGDAIAVTHLALNLGASLLFIALAVATLRRLPWSYGVFTVAVVVYFLSLGETGTYSAVAGNGRYVLMAFPAFMLLGLWGARRRVNELLLIGMPPLLALLAAHFLMQLASG